VPSLVSATWSAWRAANLPPPGTFAERDFASAIVKLGVRVPRSARTAGSLGAEREGTGVVIDDQGLILTIGYLLLDADSVLLVASDGRVMPAAVVGIDHASGFGLLRARQPLGGMALEIGDATAARELTTAMVATHPGAGGLSGVSIVSRRDFTGWWEYALDDALFTAPARDQHSGAALLNADGKLIGIGSLWVGDAINGGAAFPGNMFVPTDSLPAILPDLLTHGRRAGAARPWLGVYSEEVRSHVLVTEVLRAAPADLGGLKRGDVILAINGAAIGNQAEFYAALWNGSRAGDEITLQIWRDKVVHELTIRSIDRMDYLRPWSASTH
jgi:S1-C subfamily serine protease